MLICSNSRRINLEKPLIERTEAAIVAATIVVEEVKNIPLKASKFPRVGS
jgi:hypothetical protein